LTSVYREDIIVPASMKERVVELAAMADALEAQLTGEDNI
jgi:hypothetical protein